MLINQEITVLLVDDDTDQREYIAAKLMKYCRRCNVLSAQNTHEALALSQKHKIDLVISDFLMPGGTDTGVDLLRLIHQQSEEKPLAMLVTGFPDLLPNQAFEAGISAVFCKPFDVDSLLTTAFEKMNLLQDAA